MWYTYNLSLITKNEMEDFTNDFEEMMKKIFNEDKDYFKKFKEFNKMKFYTLVKELIKNYKELDITKQKNFKNIFEANYNVTNVILKNNKIYTFEDVEKLCSTKIRKTTEELCKYLYKTFKDSNKFIDTYISPLEYYKKFIENKVILGNCPFCGITKLETGIRGIREDYDHYLLKSMYPFVSLNYKNLAPMCKHCNTSYKGDKDIILNDKIYFPFESQSLKNILEIKKLENTLKEDCIKEIQIISKNQKEEENKSWDKIFQINDRSKEKLNEEYKTCLGVILKIKNLCPESKIEIIAHDLMENCKDNLYVGVNLYHESIYRYIYTNYKDDDEFEEMYYK
ncbi:MAG: hypothetical protein ACRCZI_01275 [Cetobacterium sp.]